MHLLGLGANIGVKFEGSLEEVSLKGCLWMVEDGGQDEGESIFPRQQTLCSSANPYNSEPSVFYSL